MRWESILWVAAALISPVIARLTWPRFRHRLLDWAPYIESFAPWAHGIAPAYIALITGAIRSRDFGLYGHSTLAWIGGMIMCAAWLVLSVCLWRSPGQRPTPTRGALDEPRWALYRSAAMLWIGDLHYALLAGLGLAILEWSLSLRDRPLRWEALARLGGSSLVFALTRNFWLTVFTQAVRLELLRRADP